VRLIANLITAFLGKPNGFAQHCLHTVDPKVSCNFFFHEKKKNITQLTHCGSKSNFIYLEEYNKISILHKKSKTSKFPVFFKLPVNLTLCYIVTKSWIKSFCNLFSLEQAMY